MDYLLLLESLPFGVVYFDFNGKTLYLNQCFLSQMKYTRDQLPDLDTWLSLAYRDAESRKNIQLRLAHLFQRVATGNLESPAHLSHVCTATGEVRLFEMTGRVLSEGVLVSLNDVTERFQSRCDTAAAWNTASLGILTGGLAHDFNNLLGGISGYLDLARASIDQIEKSKTYMEKAMGCFERARGFTDKMLAVGRKSEPRRAECDLVEILRGSSWNSFAGTAVRLDLDLEPTLPKVLIDELQLRSVLQLFFRMVLRSLPLGGSAKVKAESFRVFDRGGSLPQGEYVKIEIHDSGPTPQGGGIYGALNPFEAEDPDPVALGFYVASRVIKKHMGLVGIENRDGNLLTVFLPAADDERDELFAPDSGEETRGSVLIVEGEEFLRKTMESLARSCGWNAVATGSGMDALDLYRQGMKNGTRFDAVIIDLGLHDDLDGIHTLSQLKNCNQNLKAIATSAYFGDPVLSDPVRYGFVSCLKKPVTKQDLEKALDVIKGKEKS